jgi:hypothetical protein
VLGRWLDKDLARTNLKCIHLPLMDDANSISTTLDMLRELVGNTVAEACGIKTKDGNRYSLPLLHLSKKCDIFIHHGVVN